MIQTLEAPVQAQTDYPIDTNGWDLVYAARFPLFNQNIKDIYDREAKDATLTDDKKTFPAKFSHEVSKGVTISGEFGLWQLVAGGQGQSVRFSITVSNGMIAGMGLFTNGVDPVHADSFTCIVEAHLDWVQDSDRYLLHYADEVLLDRLNHKTPPGYLPIFVADIDWGNSTQETWYSESADGIVKEAITAWLQKNPATLKHSFNAVFLNQVAKNPAMQWMKPTSTAYAVVDAESKDINDSIFGLLCMVDKRINNEASVQVDANTIADAKSDMAILLSPYLILNHLLLPGLPKMFQNAQTTDFTVTDDTITNTYDEEILHQKDDDGNVISPKVKAGNFALTLDGNAIKMAFTGLSYELPAHEGIWVNMTHTSRARLSVNSQGKLQLYVDPALGGAENTVDVTVDSSITTLYAVLAIVTSVAGAVAGGLAAGFIAGVAGGVADAAGAAATDIADGVTQEVVVNAVDETVTIADDTMTNASEESFDDAASDLEAGEEAGTNPSRMGNIKTYFVRNWPKMLGSTLGSMLGIPIGMVPLFLRKAHNDDTAPTLDDFGNEVLRGALVANIDGSELKVNGGVLNGAFSIGFTYTPKKS